MIRVINVEPRSKQWHEIRKRIIGSSDIASLFPKDDGGFHGFSTPFELYHKKLGNITEELEDNQRMKRGRQLERIIAEMACEDNGWELQPDPQGVYINEEVRGSGATPDFFAVCPARGMGVIECKNIDFLIFRDEWVDGEPPLKYLLQLQQQLDCTGLSWGAVVALVGGNDLRVYIYERHEAAIAAIREKIATFWKWIDEGKEPKAVADDFAIVGNAYERKPAEAVIDLSRDNEMPMLCAELLQATETRKRAEDVEAGLKAQIIQKLQGHAAAQVQGFLVAYPERTRVNKPRGESITTYKQLTIKEIK